MEPLRLSVFIEWENVPLAELGRSRRMLQQLVEQARQLRSVTPDHRRGSLPPALPLARTARALRGADRGQRRAVDREHPRPPRHLDFELRFEATHGLHTTS